MNGMILFWLLPLGAAACMMLLVASRPSFFKPRIFIELAAGLLVAGSPFIAILPFTAITKAVLFVLQGVLVFLAARLLFGRLDKFFVYPSTRVNVCIVLGVIVSVCGAWLVAFYAPGVLGGYDWRWAALCSVGIGAQVVFLRQLMWSFRHYRIAASDKKRNLKELPTVSVCIPARNEDAALTNCLTAVIASTYPKLEIIVLDDCSQDKTSAVIRSFAHEGVRFVQGETPADGWLGKNQALQTLAEHASGDYILFIDADTTLSPTSVEQLVNYTLDAQVEMVAVLPQSRLGALPGAVFDTLHDFWQMVLPITKRRISVAEQAWFINADTLKSLGSFKAVAHKITPSTTFARRLFGSNKYRFIAGNLALGVTTGKKWQSEVDTAIRVLYPTYRRQPVFALAVIVYIGLFELAPFMLTTWLLMRGENGWLLGLAIALSLLALVTFALVRWRTHPHAWVVSTLLLPVLAMQEIVLIVVSLFSYEFGEVNWKGRNVCYPVILSERNRPADRPLAERHRS